MRELGVKKFCWGFVVILLLWVPAFAQAELLISVDEAYRFAQIAALQDDRFYAGVSDDQGFRTIKGASVEYAKVYPVYREGEPEEEVAPEEGIPDPLEGYNRAMFAFNDWFYFNVFKPVAKGYSAAVPEVARVGVRNFFDNLLMPIRFVNALLQAKPKQAGIELSRFIVNSSVGIAGFVDIATKDGMVTKDEDFGQTLGVWGVDHGFYFIWPFLGPSSLRDSFGMAGDYMLSPVTYLYLVHPAASSSVRVYEYTNEGSLRIGDYEDLIEAAVDAYVAVRDAYYQRRKKQVEE